MSRSTDKDFDRLLRRGVAAGAETSGEAHASAEILAAWSERTLAPAEQRRWDDHFSRCDRCQEELVAFAATSGAEAPRAAWWQRFPLPSFPAVRWAVAGATAVLALSVAIRLFPEAERRMAEELAAPPSAPAPAGDRELAAKQAAPRSLDRYELPPPAPAEPDASFADLRENRMAGRGGDDEEVAEGFASSRSDESAAKPAPAEAPMKSPLRDRAASEPGALETAPRRDSAIRALPPSGTPASTAAAPAVGRAAPAEPESAPAGEKKAGAEELPRARPFSPPKAIARHPESAGEAARLESRRAPERQDADAGARATGSDDAERAGEAARLELPRAAEPRGDPVQRSKESDDTWWGQRREARPADAPTGERPQAAAPEAAGALLSETAAPSRHILVASPERTHLWRIGDSGRIEHAAGEGEWSAQESGVHADLLGGMSPMERVCWVVGRAGTILRTIDAETWRRVSAPTEADLVHVFAADAYHATVTTTSGESYRTEDGGLHWRALPLPTPAP